MSRDKSNAELYLDKLTSKAINFKDIQGTRTAIGQTGNLVFVIDDTCAIEVFKLDGVARVTNLRNNIITETEHLIN